MPRASRLMSRENAKTVRAVGESITVLLPPAPNTDRTTPANILAADAPINPTLMTKVYLYAIVTFHPSETITYSPAGRNITRKARIEVPINNMATMQACWGVQLSDGSILEKKSESVNEERTAYFIETEGFEGVKQ